MGGWNDDQGKDDRAMQELNLELSGLRERFALIRGHL
jgi:hypothetical protein